MAKKLVFVWSDPKVRVNMNQVMEQRNFAPCHNTQYMMFMQPKYRNKVENELLVLGVPITHTGAKQIELFKIHEPDLRYIAIDIEGVSQEDFHHWSVGVLDLFPELMFFDPKVGGNVFDKLRGELHA